MKLTAAHRALIKLLAAAAVEEFFEKQQIQEKQMEKGERIHAPRRAHSD